MQQHILGEKKNHTLEIRGPKQGWGRTLNFFVSVLIKIVTTQTSHSLRKIILQYIGLHLQGGCRKSEELQWKPEAVGRRGQDRLCMAVEPSNWIFPEWKQVTWWEVSQPWRDAAVPLCFVSLGTVCWKYSAYINMNSVHTASLSLSHFCQRSTLPWNRLSYQCSFLGLSLEMGINGGKIPYFLGSFVIFLGLHFWISCNTSSSMKKRKTK